MVKIMVGQSYRFAYPEAFVTLPDYTAHRGQVVVVERAAKRGEEYDVGCNDHFWVRAADGWLGIADVTELEPIDL